MGIMDNEENLSLNDVPEGFSYWIEEEIDAIEFARDNNLEQSEEIQKEWLTYKKLPPPPDPRTCSAGYGETKEPLLATRWGQGVGYNSSTPNLGCQSVGYGGHAPTGCVATATAQVMKYFEHPTGYVWANMPELYGTNDTSTLMRHIGNNVGMKYDCDGSGAKTVNAAGALVNSFGYSQAFAGDYNNNTVLSELMQNKPVVIAGGEKKYWAIFPYYAEGHAWVADGYMRGFECYYDDNGYVNGGYGYLLFHINWGWNGAFNGYFGYNNFSVNNNSYNYKNKMVYGIRK